VLCQLVQKNLETFLAQMKAESDGGLPEFVKKEFDAFLECGILAHGFVRARCGGFAHEKLIAFSCKRRGFCPSAARGAFGGSGDTASTGGELTAL